MNYYITQDSMTRLWSFIESLTTEVGGFGYAFIEDDGNLLWRDVFLVPQHVTSSEVDFEATNGDAAAIERAVTDGVLDQDNFVWVSWHSHHTMDAFWSRTDEKRIEGLAKSGISALLSFVGTHSHKYRARLDMFNVDHAGLSFSQITMDELKLELDPLDPVAQAVAAEIKANVSKPPKPKAPAVTVWDKQAQFWRKDDPGEKVEKALRTHEEPGVDDGLIFEDPSWWETEGFATEAEAIHWIMSEAADEVTVVE